MGQLGNPGTITSTSTGTTPDGNITGVSKLSISSGVVSTYSATEFDPTASLDYDSQTVATLFDNGSQSKQIVSSIINGSTSGSITATANAWDDYDLQTDHSAVAFFVLGGYYYNPLGYGDGGSCTDESGDCGIDVGTAAYYISVAEIYLGSTVADQENVPQNAAPPPLLGTDMYGSFIAEAGQPATGPVLQPVIDWGTALLV